MMLTTYTCATCRSWAGRNPTGLVQCSIPRGHKRGWETAQTLHMDTGNLFCLWSLMRSPRSEMPPLCEQTFPASVISQASPLGISQLLSEALRTLSWWSWDGPVADWHPRSIGSKENGPLGLWSCWGSIVPWVPRLDGACGVWSGELPLCTQGLFPRRSRRRWHPFIKSPEPVVACLIRVSLHTGTENFLPLQFFCFRIKKKKPS